MKTKEELEKELKETKEENKELKRKVEKAYQYSELDWISRIIDRG